MLAREFPSKPASSEILSRMDDLFLHAATFLSFMFLVLTLMLNIAFLDIISVIIYIIALIIVYGFALYVGYIWGSIKYDSVFHRIRGWIYLIEGTVGFSILYIGFLLFPPLIPYLESLQRPWDIAIVILLFNILFAVYYIPWEKLIIPKIRNFMYERVKVNPTNEIQELFNETQWNGKQLPMILFIAYNTIYTIPTNTLNLDWINLIILPFLVFFLYDKEKTIRSKFHGDTGGKKKKEIEKVSEHFFFKKLYLLRFRSPFNSHQLMKPVNCQNSIPDTKQMEPPIPRKWDSKQSKKKSYILSKGEKPFIPKPLFIRKGN